MKKNIDDMTFETYRPLFEQFEKILAVKHGRPNAFLIMFGLMISRSLDIKVAHPDFWKGFQEEWLLPSMHILTSEKPTEALELMLEDLESK
jgi:hypothetical protein